MSWPAGASSGAQGAAWCGEGPLFSNVPALAWGPGPGGALETTDASGVIREPADDRFLAPWKPRTQKCR